MKWLVGLLLCLLPALAFAQNPSGTNPAGPARALSFGNTPLYTSTTAPINLQAVCNMGGKLGGCSGGGAGVSGIGGTKTNTPGSDNIVNVLNYGAKGDGVTDDTAAIQSAINAAEALAIGTGPSIIPTVYFPFGNYKVGCSGVPVTVKNDTFFSAAITISGAGPSASRIISSGCGVVPALFFEPQLYKATFFPNVFAAPLVGSTGQSLSWPAGTPGNYYINLKEVNQGSGIGSGAWFASSALVNAQTAYSFEAFFQFPNTLTNGNTYTITDSAGNDGITTGTFTNIHITPGATNTTLSGLLTLSDGAHTISASIANATIAANTVHSLELNMDPGSGAGGTVNFFLDGTKVNTSSATANGSTTSQLTSEQWLIGESNAGVFNGNPGANLNHWVGQIFSIRVSNIARHTANFTAPVAAFANDSNTMLLMNATTTNDVWIKLDKLTGSTLAALPLHTEQLANGNNGSTVRDLGLQGGSYGLLNIGSLYLNLNNLTVLGSEEGIRYENNAYGGDWSNISVNGASFSQAAFELDGNSGHTNISGLLTTGQGSYEGILLNSDVTISNALAFVFGQVAIGWVINGLSLGHTVFNNVQLGTEGFTQPFACYAFSGWGSFVDISGHCANTGNVPAIQWNPSAPAPFAAGPQFVGTAFTIGASSANVLNFNGSAAVGSPARFDNVNINGSPIGVAAIPTCSLPTKCVVEPKAPITLTTTTPTMTVVSGGDATAETDTQLLPGNTTLTSFASTVAPVTGKTFHVILTQPTGAHNYTFAFSAGAGVNIIYPTSGGCVSLPTMPTGTGHSLLLDMVYNTNPPTSPPELDVVSCVQTGS